ncbi:hypothetical protein [Rathayibacter sp. VKM Ac-2630]|uniref:hypothetical protein n=1 Tax=Rathayibacter sp. VKM Ac-2630 TaxID=1938617 RepID=UPI000980AC49|nr:hypothetical protein [Rathayibacter sp. VKM Ac-2630]OOB90291.1 hypothetical protein B0T42_12375 [Rathayibacter sp. VKM Ac-2630]
MAELLAEPDLVDGLIDWLPERLEQNGAKATVSGRVEDAPHVRIVDTGGTDTRDGVLVGQQITLECFGRTLTESSRLMRVSSALIRSLVGEDYLPGVIVYRVGSLGGGANSADQVTKRNRYTRTLVVDTRLTAL